MPRQTLDIRRGLEAYYDFDPRYYDEQRNLIQDKSGYSRNASAVGAPSLGIEGPASFESASFDGVDDYFSVGTNLVDSSPLTYWALAKFDVSDDGNYYGIIGNNNGNDTFLAQLPSGQIAMRVYDTDSASFKAATAVNTLDAGNWYSLVGIADGSYAYCYAQKMSGNKVSVGKEAYGGTEEWGAEHNIATRDVDGSGSHDGAIAAAGVWSRVLSAPEIKKLNDISAPIRLQL